VPARRNEVKEGEYTWYAYDAGGMPMAVYKQSFVKQTATTATMHFDVEEQDVYGSGRLGVRHGDEEGKYSESWTNITMNGNIYASYTVASNTAAYVKTHYTRELGKKQYEIANHLGNVLVTVSDKRLCYSATPSTATVVDWYVADVVSFTDYYVFGAPQTGRAGGEYRYGFNGKENDKEVKGIEGSHQDYGMRMYDPRVGRFFSADPLKISYPYYTPYQFAGNDPINYIDLDGAEKQEPSNGSNSGGLGSKIKNFFAHFTYGNEGINTDNSVAQKDFDSDPNPYDYQSGATINVRDANGNIYTKVLTVGESNQKYWQTAHIDRATVTISDQLISHWILASGSLSAPQLPPGIRAPSPFGPPGGAPVIPPTITRPLPPIGTPYGGYVGAIIVIGSAIYSAWPDDGITQNPGGTNTPDNMPKEKEPNGDVYYHYTDEQGFSAIMSSGVLQANAKGKIYLTKSAFSPASAEQILFINNPYYKGKGDYVVQFYVRPDQNALITPAGGGDINEYIYFGSTLRIKGQIMYSGTNPF
jgi:RHS repeat-associated protein